MSMDIPPLRGRVELDISDWSDGIGKVKSDGGEAAKAIQMVESQAGGLANTMTKTSGATTALDVSLSRSVATGNTTTAAIAAMSQQMETAGVSASRLGMNKLKLAPILQQAGYQVGDFATQVSAGGNAMIAATQQGTQLLGMFGPLGAVAGALVGTFALVAMRLDLFGDSLEDIHRAKMTEATEGLNALNDRTKDWAESLAATAQQAERLLAIIRAPADQRERMQASDRFDANVDRLKAQRDAEKAVVNTTADTAAAAAREARRAAEQRATDLKLERFSGPISAARDATLVQQYEEQIQAAIAAADKLDEIEATRKRKLAGIERDFARSVAASRAAEQEKLRQDEETRANQQREREQRERQRQFDEQRREAGRLGRLRLEIEADNAKARGDVLNASLRSIEARYAEQIASARTREEYITLIEKVEAEKRVEIARQEDRDRREFERELREYDRVHHPGPVRRSPTPAAGGNEFAPTPPRLRPTPTTGAPRSDATPPATPASGDSQTLNQISQQLRQLATTLDQRGSDVVRTLSEIRQKAVVLQETEI